MKTSQTSKRNVTSANEKMTNVSEHKMLKFFVAK